MSSDNDEAAATPPRVISVVVPPPKPLSFYITWTAVALLAVGPALIFYLVSSKLRMTVSKVLRPRDDTIQSRDDARATKFWTSEAGKIYRDIVEYQIREGFCASATLRNILKSIPSFSRERIPEQVRKPTELSVIKDRFDALFNESNGGESTMTKFKTSIVYGSDVSKAEMVGILRKVNNPRYRICANYLRAAALGIAQPWWLPHNLMLGIFAGHFSPVVGFFEDEGVVAIFDVNENYGLCFVSIDAFYNSVATYDVLSGASRGLVVIELP